MRISIITVCFNAAKTIRDTCESVLSQVKGSGVEIEHIVVDGGSTDGTVDILQEFASKPPNLQTSKLPTLQPSKLPTLQTSKLHFRWLSEKDNGLYDAMNKGIRMATGDVVGILNADDVLAEDDTLAKVAAAFEDPEIDGTYADIRFVRDDLDAKDANVATEISAPARRFAPGAELISVAVSDNTAPNADLRQARSAVRTQSSLAQNGDLRVEKLRNLSTVRYCSGKWFRPWMFRFGVLPAHPSVFIRRECFERYGFYSTDYRICADFELLLRFIWKHRIPTRYLPLCTTVMRTGGLSTAGWRSNLQINREDLRALKAHGCWSCLPLIYLKYLFKIWGFVFRR